MVSKTVGQYLEQYKFQPKKKKEVNSCAQQLLRLSHNLTSFTFTDLYSAHLQESCRDSTASLLCRHFPPVTNSYVLRQFFTHILGNTFHKFEL